MGKYSLPQLQTYGGFIGLTVSGIFLIVIGLINLFILIDIYKNFIGMRRGEYKEESIEKMLSGGALRKIIRVLYSFINKSWHVYFLGFMFGLGFDTASQIAILATSAGAASQTQLSVYVLAFPILFTAGMSLMDTADGFFMTTAYQWVFSTPIRKMYYNMTVTGLSVIAALFIGSIEIAQMITPRMGLHTGIWLWVQNLNFNMMGYMMVVIFILVWVISYGGWKLLRLDEQ